jgi:phage terminase small subunit
MMHRSAAIIRMFAEQFGLTPSARTRLGKDVVDEDDDDRVGILS